MHTLGIDIETYSSIDLTKCGVYRYTESPDFTILLFGYSIDGGPAIVVDMADPMGEGLPFDVELALTDPMTLKTAHNASFERTCIAKYFGIECRPEQWECTLIKAAMLGLPLALESVAKVLHLEEQKNNAGKALIRFFCIPRKPTKNNDSLRNMPEDFPEKWTAFIGYCAQDVVVEQKIRQKISWFTIPQQEMQLWWLDQRINDRGVMLDRTLIKNAVAIDNIFRARLAEEAIQLTGLNNPNSAKQLKTWLSDETGAEVKTLRKDDLPGLLKSTDDETVTRVLEIRAEMAKTSIKKYVAMQRYICKDGRVRGIFQFCGANRTWRWAGRGIQPHNLPRVSYKKKSNDLDIARNLVLQLAGDEIEMLFGNVADTLSQLLRTAFIPAPGKRFKVADFSAIEARVIAWLAQEQWRLDVFKTHGMIYEASAAAMFKIHINDVTEEQRQRGKVAELALGFQGGKNALIAMDTKKLLNKDELQSLVTAWRKNSAKIVELWKTVQTAAINAVETGQVYGVGFGISYYTKNGILFAQLPSGRALAYQAPKVKKTIVRFVTFLRDTGVYTKDQKALLPVALADKYEAFGAASGGSEPFENKSLSYEGWIQEKNIWGTIHTYGGSLVENLVQAIARDCLAHAMTSCDTAGEVITMHVHDEIVIESPDGEGSLDQVCKIMTTDIPWAPGLPLGANGFEGKYYKK